MTRNRLIFALLAFSALAVAAPKLETFYRTKTGDKYHKDGCRYLSKSKIAVTQDEVVKYRLVACKVCKP